MTDSTSFAAGDGERDQATLKTLATLQVQIRVYSLAALALVVVGAAIGAWGMFQFDSTEDDLSKFGEFMSGAVAALWSLAGLLLIYVAFLGQRRQIVHQEEELHLNRIELRATRDELRGQREQLEQQTLTARLQQFESTFFQRLHLLNTIVDSLRLEGQTLQIGNRYVVQQGSGREVFRILAEELHSRLTAARAGGDLDWHRANAKAWRELFDRHGPQLGVYFRTLYHLLEFVHFSTLPASVRKSHADLIRAQLSSYESVLLLHGCLAFYGVDGFKPLIEAYSLFRYLRDVPGAGPEVRDYFDAAAFDDGGSGVEQISS